MGREFRELSMMKLLVLFASVLLASAKNINVKQLEYGFCEGAPQPLSIDELTVMPDPVELKTGATVTISATITLNEIVPTGSQVGCGVWCGVVWCGVVCAHGVCGAVRCG